MNGQATNHHQNAEICNGVRSSSSGNGRLFESEEEELCGQAEAWRFTFAFVDSLAVKSAVLLGIPDIIARRGPNATLSLSQIAAHLPAENPDVNCLFRILRFLVAKKFFRAEIASSEEGVVEMRYGLTPASKWLVKDGVMSMADMLLLQNDPTTVAPWHHFNECVIQGRVAFEKANGPHIWDYACAHPDYNDLFKSAMAGHANILMKAILSEYQGFRGLKSLVDVGGGTGTAVAEIVKAYPAIKGFNYDLPHVVTTAPNLPGVEHIGGDMFESVPSADAVFMKWIMHDWPDDECVKILRGCRKAVGERGKVIIVDVVLDGGEKAALDPSLGIVFDLILMAHTSVGKQRTEEEWKKVLQEGGFPRFNVISIPALQSIVEAFPY